jgi:ribosomal protein S18 acetylase RimI-like enzyme
MQHILDNPIYNALIIGNSHLSLGEGTVRYFPKEISPFAGLKELDENSFALLADMLPPKRKVATITADKPAIPNKWKITNHSTIWQMLGDDIKPQTYVSDCLVPLNAAHVPQMLALTKMTNPGPFLQRTIEFGNYAGIFDREQLIAMGGHRLHAGQYVEISAVCTHPNYAGKGYGGLLMRYQAQGIIRDGITPFLHVRADNEQAIMLYYKLGFVLRSEMHINIIEK